MKHSLSARSRKWLPVGLILAVLLAVLPLSLALATPHGVVAYTNVIFLHHSTGANLIDQGNVRPLLTNLGYSFWDHGYNSDGLTMPDGSSAGYNYDIPGDNTDPDGFNAIFAQTLYTQPQHPQPPTNAFSGLMRHEVIAFKSCFPVTAIGSEAQLEQYKTYYRNIRARVDQYPNRIFIAFTPPPLHPDSTNPADAARARAFAHWLKSADYLAGHPNLFVFDFFDLLAESSSAAPDFNMLRAAYRPSGGDSHPNALANQTIGPIFANFVDQAVKTYSRVATRTPGPSPTVTPTSSGGQPTATSTPTKTPAPTKTASPTPTNNPNCTSRIVQRGTFGTVADAYIWASSPDYTGNWEQLYTGIVGDGRKRTLIRFNLEFLPTGVVVDEATISIYRSDSGGSRTINLHRITAPWSESGVTWNNFGGYDPAVLGTFNGGLSALGGSGSGWKTVNVTSLVQGWIAKAYPNDGLLLDDPTTVAGEYETYGASENATISVRPKLAICYHTGSTATASPTLSPSFTPTRIATGTATSTPTDTPTRLPTGTPTSTPTHTPTRSPTRPPTPTGTQVVPPKIFELRPNQGTNDVPNEITIFGSNFVNGATATLDTNPPTSLTNVVYKDSNVLRATVPGGLPAGRYPLRVTNPNGAPSNDKAYTVIDPVSDDDLYANPYDLYTDPVSIHEGDQAGLYLNVHRQGGTTTLSNIIVRFFDGDPATGGARLGDGRIYLLEPRGSQITTRVNWDTAGQRGAHTLYAVIDPANAITETVETNNVVSATVTVLRPVADTIPPVVTAFQINDGAALTASPQVTLTTRAEDLGGSSVGAMLFVEFVFNQAVAQWVPVQASDWLSYTTRYDWSLVPVGGMHYLQAWAADRAGNISLAPRKARINYVPPHDHVGANQTRAYRHYMAAGQYLTVEVTPLSGDPDLFVWPPTEGSAPWVSDNSGAAVDRVSFQAPTAGTYQIEVFGYIEASYSITIQVTNTPPGQITSAEGSASLASPNAGKPVPSTPVVQVSNDPAGQMAVPPALPCYDFTDDWQVNVDDVQSIAGRWHLIAANPDPDGNPTTPNYASNFDVDHDGDIDIVDIMRASTQWGQTCP